MSALTDEALVVALSQVGVREEGRNRGPEVDVYLRSVGLDPESGVYAWCASFVFYCYEQAAATLGLPNPCPRRAGALRMRDAAPAVCRTTHPSPGALFFIDHGQGKGHVGFVVSVEGNDVKTIEGNTNGGGSREGDGVYARTRHLSEINGGYVDFGRLAPARADVA